MEPNQALITAPEGSPPAPGTNSIWSTIQSITTAAAGVIKQVETTIQSTGLAKAQTTSTIPVAKQPDYKMWAILALAVLVLIAWLK